MEQLETEVSLARERNLSSLQQKIGRMINNLAFSRRKLRQHLNLQKPYLPSYFDFWAKILGNDRGHFQVYSKK